MPSDKHQGRPAIKMAAKSADRDPWWPFENPERRRERWLRWHRRERRRLHFWDRFPVGPEGRQALPADLAGAWCCAHTRLGLCKRTDLNEINGRCPAHGGKSTGPKSDDGKGKMLANLRQEG